MTISDHETGGRRANTSREFASRTVLTALSSMASGFAFAAFAIAIINFLRDGNLSIVSFNLTLGLIFSATWLAVRQGRVPASWAHPVVVALVVVALSNTLFTFLIRVEMLQANIAALLAVAAGSVMLSTRWLTLCLSLITVAWTVTAWKVVPSAEQLLPSCTTVWAAIVLSAVIHSARLRTHQRLSKALLESRTSEEKYRLLFQQSKDVVSISTPAGRLIDINQAGVELFGSSSKEELLDLDIPSELYHEPLERNRLLTELESKGFVKDYESRCRTRSGQVLTVEGTTTVVRNEDDEIIAYLAILRDITDRKRVEAELMRHREHLEELVEQRTARLSEAISNLEQEIQERERVEEERRRFESQFEQTQKLESLGIVAGGVAHDFNNLLVGMLGNADLARNQLPTESPSRLHLERIVIAAQRAADLTRQMLVYAGKGQFVFEACHLPELIEEMASLLTLSISKKASFDLRFDKGLPPIRADLTQIRQVVMNLMTNASDALGDEEGFITVRVEGPSGEGPSGEGPSGEGPSADRRILLEISDTGCGMDEATKKKIFDPFFTTKRSGRGLGMAAVLGIIRSHKGEIQIDSQPGYGTTFRILIPVWEQTTESVPLQEAVM